MTTPLHVLILEDSPTDAEVMVHRLQEAGYAPRWQRVEGEADFLARLEPSLDLILADYTLPDWSGRRALELLQERGWDIPTIIVTGSVSEETALECLRLGAADYLLKDRLARLGEAVRSALAQRSLRREWAAAEAARQAGDARAHFLADVLEHSSQPFAVADPDGRLTLCNGAYCRLLGYPEAELRALDWSRDLTPAQWRAHEADHLARLRRTGGPVRYQKEYLRKDGSRVPVELLVHLERSSAGGPLYQYAFITDLGERLRAEEALRQSEERFRRIFESNMLGIAFWHADGRLSDANRVFGDLLGYTPAEIRAGQVGWPDVTPPELLARDRQAIAEMHARGVCTPYEKQFVHRDGHLVTVLMGGTLLGAAPDPGVAFALDITERKRAEAALAERTRQLEAVRTVSEEITHELDLGVLLDLIIHRAADLVGAVSGTIWLWDETESVLVPWAWRGLGEWLKEFRLRPGEGAPGTIAERRGGLIVNDYRTSPYALPVMLAYTNITALVGEPLLYRDRLIGVLVINNEGTGRPFTEEHRKVLALCAAQAAIAIQNAHLFAELKRSYLDLQKTQDELVRSKKLGALGQLAAGIAHEFNNKLAVLLGQVELLRVRGEPADVRQGLDVLEAVVMEAGRMVRRLHDFASQRTKSPLAPLDLAFLVEETLELTRPRWQEDLVRQGHEIAIRTSLDGLPPILGNAAEIQETLTNLILNAVDAMPQGGTLTLAARLEDGDRMGSPVAGVGARVSQPTVAAVRIGESARPPAQPEWVALAVTDTGSGMSDEVRQRIFDPFFTTKGVQRAGLGLSVVYGIMERHAGKVDVVSVPGKGTTVSLRFRVAPREASKPASAAVTAQFRRRRILLVDDDVSVRRTMAALLEAVGHTVVEAGGGADGIARLAETPVDLVLTDLGMPEMTGREVARAVKARTPSLPVVLLTGWGEQALEEQGREAFVDRVLGKPVSLRELLSLISELTDRSGAGPD